MREWWCLGDLVGYGADPGYCLAAGREAARCIAGNHDLGASGRIDLDDFASWARDALAWTREELGPVGRATLNELEPADLDGEVHLVHGSPRDPVWEYVLSREQALDALTDRRVALTFCGHTHIPAAWRLGPDGTLTSVKVTAGVTVDVGEGRWLINPGSVGQPRDGDPRAAWAVYDPEAQAVTFQRTPYDVAGAQNAILSAGLPELLANRLATGV